MTPQGLMGWWKNNVRGGRELSRALEFRSNGGGPDFKVSELIK
ncbi:MAG: hypothetical protein V7784_12770 [Oceanospirillaceae bacterium]